jgi:GT2 family glycosyltransferase
MTPRITVGITTRNRPESLRRCLDSLGRIAHLSPQILVFDDGSNPVAATPPGVTLIHDPTSPGYIAGRNRLVCAAASPYVLLLDDDAALVQGEGVERALDLLDRDARVGAVGFPQGTSSEPASTPRYVAAFTGFAHIVRRDLFVALGGYRERLVFYGEEKEFCLRLLESGYRTVLLEGSPVAHHSDPAGRDRSRYLRYVTRNDCLDAVYNQPFHRALWIVPARLLLYFRMRRAWGIRDPFGWCWVIADLVREARPAFKVRQPVSHQTLRLWRRLRDGAEPYSIQ